MSINQYAFLGRYPIAPTSSFGIPTRILTFYTIWPVITLPSLASHPLGDFPALTGTSWIGVNGKFASDSSPLRASINKLWRRCGTHYFSAESTSHFAA